MQLIGFILLKRQVRCMPDGRQVLCWYMLWRQVGSMSQVTEFYLDSPHSDSCHWVRATPPELLLFFMTTKQGFYFWQPTNKAWLCEGSWTCRKRSKTVDPRLLLPQSPGFQCTLPGSLFHKDSSPHHVASPQTSFCVVIRSSFRPIAAPYLFFLPVVWHGPKSNPILV